MSLNLEWVMLAEAAVQDSDGVLSIIGLSQNVLVTRTFPVQTKRAIVVHLQSDTPSPVTKASVNFSVVSPSSRVIVAQTIEARLGKPRFPDIPWSMDVPAEFILSITEPGTHVFNVELEAGDERLAKSVDLHVLTAEDLIKVRASEEDEEDEEP